ncbi:MULTISPECIES: hypothetical protein [Aeromonas]|uniref:hypothetical protein n=2 Tax=Aeromonas TaxID=642 RepID=UPI002A762FAB|nr:hypothetical protein [Aeromonas jandaei]
MSNMIQELAMNIDNWVPVREASIDGMNYQILLRCLSKRSTDAALGKCCRKIGNRLFINTKLFGLWMAGEL